MQVAILVSVSVLAVLVYFLTGVLFLLAYMRAMLPQPRETQLGLIAVFWPIVLAIDIVLAASTQLGAVGKRLNQRSNPAN